MKHLSLYENIDNIKVQKIVDHLMRDTINYLHDYGYSDANVSNIFTDRIYSFQFKIRLEKRLGKIDDFTDNIIYHLLYNIKTLTPEDIEKYRLQIDMNKYNL